MSCSIIGFAYIDSNANNIFDSNDIFFDKLNVFLYSIDNLSVPIAFTTTDINGNYFFNNLDITKTYLIKAPLPSTYSLVLSNIGIDYSIQSHINPFTSYSRQLKCCENDIITINIGIKKNSSLSISGITFFDCNGDSKFNDGDSPINGVTIYLLDEAFNELYTTVSGLNSNNGYYEFTNLPPQNYIVKVIEPTNLSFTLQNLSTNGSKIDPNLGQISISLIDTSFTNLFVGFSGNVLALNKYCKSNTCLSCSSKTNKC